MFTDKIFSLNDFADVPDLNIKRDCNFSYVGKIPTRLSPRLVACQKKKHLQDAIRDVEIVGLIITPDLEDIIPLTTGYAISTEPVKALNNIQGRLSEADSGQWNSFKSKVHPTATIMQGAYVAPADVIIEENVVIYPNAVIFPRSLIGMGSSIGAGTIIGTDAFEVDTAATPRKIIPQSGGVRIGRNVDIQATCTIIRSTFGGFTEVGDESKFDCQVHLAHDCFVGKRVRIAACAEISGRVIIGDDTFIAPNVSIANGVDIGQKCHVTIGSVVVKDVEDGKQVTGNFAIEHRQWLKFVRSIR